MYIWAPGPHGDQKRASLEQEFYRLGDDVGYQVLEIKPESSEPSLQCPPRENIL